MKRNQFIMSGAMAGLATALFNSSLPAATNNSLKPFYIPPDATPLDPGSGLAIRTKVRSSQTNMQYSCVDVAVAPKTMGPAPHVHEALDELMYVYEGTITILVGKEVHHVQAGGWHFRPRGIVHTFWNGTDKVARSIDMYFNQNFEDFLEELFFQVLPGMQTGKITPQEGVARMKALDKKFGITTFDEQRKPIMDQYGLK